MGEFSFDCMFSKMFFGVRTVLSDCPLDYYSSLSVYPSMAFMRSASAWSTSTISLRLERPAFKATFMIASVLKTKSTLGFKANS